MFCPMMRRTTVMMPMLMMTMVMMPMVMSTNQPTDCGVLGWW